MRTTTRAYIHIDKTTFSIKKKKLLSHNGSFARSNSFRIIIAHVTAERDPCENQRYPACFIRCDIVVYIHIVRCYFFVVNDFNHYCLSTRKHLFASRTTQPTTRVSWIFSSVVVRKRVYGQNNGNVTFRDKLIDSNKKKIFKLTERPRLGPEKVSRDWNGYISTFVLFFSE